MPNLAYLELKDLAGISKIKKREKWHPITGFSHAIGRPVDALTLEPAKRREHSLFVVQKELDVGSHWWHNIHAKNQKLGVCRLHLYHMPPSGDEVNYLNIELVGARIVEVEQSMPSLTLQKNSTIKERERISFSYEQITYQSLSVPAAAGYLAQPTHIGSHKVGGFLSSNAVMHADWEEEQHKALATRIAGEVVKYVKGFEPFKSMPDLDAVKKKIADVGLIELFVARYKKTKPPAAPAPEPE